MRASTCAYAYIDGNRQRMLDENGNFEINVIEMAWILQFGFYLKDMDYRDLGNQDGKIDEQKLQAAIKFLCQRNGFIYTSKDSNGYGHHIAFNMDSMNENTTVISENEIGSILKEFWNSKNSSRYHSAKILYVPPFKDRLKEIKPSSLSIVSIPRNWRKSSSAYYSMEERKEEIKKQARQRARRILLLSPQVV